LPIPISAFRIPNSAFNTMPLSAPRLRRFNGIVLAVYWTALLVGTHWPHFPSFGPENTDKVLHVTAYAGLAGLLTLYVLAGRKASWRKLGLVFLILAAAGGLDELTQPPLPAHRRLVRLVRRSDRNQPRHRPGHLA
jgi:VanZ family protein